MVTVVDTLLPEIILQKINDGGHMILADVQGRIVKSIASIGFKIKVCTIRPK